jgi:hypothetical protein
MRNVLDKSCIENKNTFYVQYIFLEDCAFYEITKNVVESEGQQMMSQYGAHALHAG